MQKNLFDGIENPNKDKVSYYAIAYNARDRDWVVIFRDATRFFSFPVISHHATELEAYFEAKRKNRELQNDNTEGSHESG